MLDGCDGHHELNMINARIESKDNSKKTRSKEDAEDKDDANPEKKAETVGRVKKTDSKIENPAKEGAKIAVRNVEAAINDTSLDQKVSGSIGTNSTTSTAAASAADTASVAEHLRDDLKNHNVEKFADTLTAAVSEGAVSIGLTVDAVNRGRIHSEGSSKSSDSKTEIEAKTKPATSAIKTDHVSVREESKFSDAKDKLNKYLSSLHDATELLYQASEYFIHANSHYGKGSKESNEAAKCMNLASKTMTHLSKKAFYQLVVARTISGKHPECKKLAHGVMKMESKFTTKTSQASELLAMSARVVQDSDAHSDLHLSEKNVLGNYSSEVLHGSCVEIEIMKAMAKMEDVANTVAARQTKIEKGMENIQTKMNNFLGKQLAGENPLIAKLGTLGKKEASASQVDSGMFALPGNIYDSLKGLNIFKDAAQKKSSKRGLQGLGQTFGFVPGDANQQGNIVAVNGRLSQLNSNNQIATQKVSNLTTSVNAQGQAASSSAQSTQSINQMMTSLIGLWSKAVNQAISSG